MTSFVLHRLPTLAALLLWTGLVLAFFALVAWLWQRFADFVMPVEDEGHRRMEAKR